MSKTNALPDSRPIVQAPDSKPSPESESIPALSEKLPCPESEGLEFGVSEIAALRAFFELLDKWDRNETGE